MVGFAQVGEFVREDVVDQGWPELHGGPVDADPACRGGGSPFVAKVGDLGPAGVDAQPSGPVLDVGRSQAAPQRAYQSMMAR